MRGLDNFATGHRQNLDDVAEAVGDEAFSRFALVGGDIRDRDTCLTAASGVSIVLHQAALGSVPRSISDPLTSHDRTELVRCGIADPPSPCYSVERPGDVRHSLADISKAAAAIGYVPSHTIREGLRVALPWYIAHQDRLAAKQ